MLVLSNSVDYQHTIYTLQVVDKETKQVFVRGGETNEPCPRARSYYYSGCHSRNYLVFRLQMARW